MIKIQNTYVFKKKLLLDFKHIRLKLSVQDASYSNEISKNIAKIRINKLSEILDCTTLTAKKIVSKNNFILSLPNDTFVRNTKFCSQCLKFSDIIEFPIIISLNSSLLQHRYFSLKELGCSNITASSILKFPQILRKSPNSMRKEGITFCIDNYLDEYMCLLDSEDKNDVELRLKKMYEDGSNLWRIKEVMNAEFLASKLDCSLYKAHQMFKRYPPLRVQSILNTNHLLDVLFKTYKFSYSKVFSVPNLLSLHHEVAQNFLLDVPTILGVNTVQIANKLPLLLRRSVDSVQKIERVLKDFNISDGQLLCCPKIITFTPSTLRQRLENLCNSKDFALLKPYKKFLWLVYYYNNLSSRLQALKQYDIPCSISMFIVSKSYFDKYFCVSYMSKSYVKDICFYLSNVFNCSEMEILQRLKEYPNSNNSSLTNCNKVVEFLLNARVTKQQLLNGVGIIFYDIDVVKQYFKEMEIHPECQPFSEWVNHYNFIQLLIYKIEVDAGFRATILYRIKANLDEDAELNVSSQSG